MREVCVTGGMGVFQNATAYIKSQRRDSTFFSRSSEPMCVQRWDEMTLDGFEART